MDVTAGAGVDAAANAARGGAATTLRAVRDGGHLATITSDPPEPEREIQIASVYVRPDPAQLERATQAFDQGQLEFVPGTRFTLPDAAAALALAVQGRGGAVVLDL